MKIHLKSDYRGKPSGERIIFAGSYDEADAKLFGLASYLVETGHAVVIDGTTKIEVPTPPAEDGQTITLDGLTVQGLIDLATERGYDLAGLGSRPTKSELLEFIEGQHRSSQQGEG